MVPMLGLKDGFNVTEVVYVFSKLIIENNLPQLISL